MKTLKDIPTELSFTGKEVKELGLRFSDMPKVKFIQKVRDEKIREVGKKLKLNLQGGDTIYSAILENLPKDQRGSHAVDNWDESLFRYGTEYGMIAMLWWFLNLNEVEE